MPGDVADDAGRRGARKTITSAWFRLRWRNGRVDARKCRCATTHSKRSSTRETRPLRHLSLNHAEVMVLRALDAQRHQRHRPALPGQSVVRHEAAAEAI